MTENSSAGAGRPAPVDSAAAPHAVARLRAERLAVSTRPFLARGSRTVRCPRCRVAAAHCVCAACPAPATTRAGVCLLMHRSEPIRPSNTGWLVADAVADTWAFAWSRTEPDPRLLALLADRAWQPFVVFPADAKDAARVVREPRTADGRRPLFVLFDATWAEARKMVRRSPYLDGFPILSAAPDGPSRYGLRVNRPATDLCTAEAASLCLRLSGDAVAADALDAWLGVFVATTLRLRAQAAGPGAAPASAPAE